MKTALLLLLFCLAEADDLNWEVQELFLKLKSSLVERLINLEGQHAGQDYYLSLMMYLRYP